MLLVIDRHGVVGVQSVRRRVTMEKDGNKPKEPQGSRERSRWLLWRTEEALQRRGNYEVEMLVA